MNKPSPDPSDSNPSQSVPAEAPLPKMKSGRILDSDNGGFVLEYDNTQSQKNTMRLDAMTYERAIREAKSYLGVNQDNQDEDGTVWEIE